MLKWRCHLDGCLCQVSEHRNQYRAHNGHLKASKWGAFLLTGWPWHLPGLDRVSHRETQRQTSWQIGPSPPVFVGSPSPLPGKPLPDNGLGWLNPDHCSGYSVNKKPPPGDGFKWPLQALYWFPCSETWQRHPSKWHLHFCPVRIGTITLYIGLGLDSDLGHGGGATERPRACLRSLWHFPLTLVWINPALILGDGSLSQTRLNFKTFHHICAKYLTSATPPLPRFVNQWFKKTRSI